MWISKDRTTTGLSRNRLYENEYFNCSLQQHSTSHSEVRSNQLCSTERVMLPHEHQPRGSSHFNVCPSKMLIQPFIFECFAYVSGSMKGRGLHTTLVTEAFDNISYHPAPRGRTSGCVR